MTHLVRFLPILPFFNRFYTQEWLRINNRNSAKPKDLMPYLIEKGVFNRDHRQGLPLRIILRKLDELGKLALIRGLRVERKEG
jgi:hypothetical protein